MEIRGPFQEILHLSRFLHEGITGGLEGFPVSHPEHLEETAPGGVHVKDVALFVEPLCALDKVLRIAGGFVRIVVAGE